MYVKETIIELNKLVRLFITSVRYMNLSAFDLIENNKLAEGACEIDSKRGQHELTSFSIAGLVQIINRSNAHRGEYF